MLGDDDAAEFGISGELYPGSHDGGGGGDIEGFGCAAGATGVDEDFTIAAGVFDLLDMCPHRAGCAGEGSGVWGYGLDQRQERPGLGFVELSVEQRKEGLLGGSFVERGASEQGA